MYLETAYTLHKVRLTFTYLMSFAAAIGVEVTMDVTIFT